MSYLHIENLYKSKEILMFRECFALEKVDGSSSHVSFNGTELHIFAGGAKHEEFIKIFDQPVLIEKFKALSRGEDITVFGEAYGGKLQGMSHTYGKQLAFIAFEVKIGTKWLSIPDAEEIVKALGLSFVPYKRISTDLAAIDAERDAPSEVAFLNGCADRNNPATYKIREGVVLRPIMELTKNNGGRIVAKHKRPEFSERGHTPKVNDPEKQAILESADAVVKEWVTPCRLDHVLDKLGNPTDLSAIPKIITAMIEDVTREAAGEIVDSKEVRKAIGAKTVKMFKERVCKI